MGSSGGPRHGAAALVSRRSVLVGVGAAAALAVVGCSDDGDGEGSGDDAGAESGEASVPGGDGPGAEVIAYGDEGELQRGALSLAEEAGSSDPVPVVVLVHGGFWRAGYDRSLMEPLVASVVAEGWAAWNIDYRPIGEGGGWPTTFTDVAAAVDHLATEAEEHGLDLDRVAVVGHSAGGTLALWSAARERLPADVPGAGPAVRPIAVVSQAGVTNLAAGAIEGLGQGAVVALMGGQPTGDGGDAYLDASPIERLPLGPMSRQLLVHGADDAIVPAEQSQTYAARARDAGDEVTLQVLADTDHLAVIDPGSEAWAGVVAWLTDRFA